MINPFGSKRKNDLSRIAAIKGWVIVDDEMQSRVALDGIVTLVDAKHIWEHIDDSEEAKEQIAFADVILLNKTDLVAPEDLDKLEARIKGMNSAARIYRTRDAAVDMNNVLDLGGFNLERALDVDPKFLEPEYPFEWSGVYELQPGRYEFVLQPGPDPTMNIVMAPLNDATSDALETVKMDAVLVFSDHEFDLMSASRSQQDASATAFVAELALPALTSSANANQNTP